MTCLTQKFTKMKKLVFMLMALILPVSLFAAEVVKKNRRMFITAADDGGSFFIT